MTELRSLVTKANRHMTSCDGAEAMVGGLTPGEFRSLVRLTGRILMESALQEQMSNQARLSTRATFHTILDMCEAVAGKADHQGSFITAIAEQAMTGLALTEDPRSPDIETAALHLRAAVSMSDIGINAFHRRTRPNGPNSSNSSIEMPSMDDLDRLVEHDSIMLSAQIGAVTSRLAVKGTTYCEECGDSIPEARRKAVPSARLCVSCQEAEERYRATHDVREPYMM